MPNIWPWTGTSANSNTKKDDDDPSNPWLCAGPISSFPNIVPAAGENQIELCPPPPSTEDDSTNRNPDDGSTAPAPPPCRVFSLPGVDASSRTSPTCTPSSSSSNHPPTPSTTPTTHLSPIPLDSGTPSPNSLLLFQYRSQIYATPYLCPHQSYPLTHASVSDIEDFGVVLSAGITCPRHGWTWDLHTGEADRGRFRLGLWEVRVRDAEGEGERMVWVRRKVRRRIG